MNIGRFIAALLLTCLEGVLDMAWIELHQSLPTHHKTIECAAMLNISVPQMVGHLCCFWLWALDNSKDGVLSQLHNALRNATVALASHWEGAPDEFVNALIASNFLEEDGENLIIHDWYDYAGRLLEQRKANRERQRRYREKKKIEDREDNGDVTVTNTVMSRGTVPNRTVPNQKNKNNNAQARSSESARKAARTKFVKKLFNDQFWPIYPRKKAKQDALKAFLAIFPISVSKEQCNRRWTHIMMHVESLKAEGRPLDKIPYPATFLRAEDFDEPPAEPSINDDDGPIFEEVE